MNYMTSINPHAAVGTGEEGRVSLEVTGKRKAKQELVGVDAYDEEKKSTESKLLSSSSLPTKKSKKLETRKDVSSVPSGSSSSSSSSSKKGPSPMAARTRSKKNAVKK